MEEARSLGGSEAVRSELVEADGGVGERVQAQCQVSQLGVDRCPQGGGERGGPLQQQHQLSYHCDDRGDCGLVSGWRDGQRTIERGNT